MNTPPSPGSAGLAYRIDDRPVDAAAFYATACDPRRSVAVEACAGAGKTWMLVSRIVRALLDGAEPAEILAITFTKKAAAEMRQRLDSLLREAATWDEPRREAELRLRGLPPDRARSLAPALGALHARLLDGGRPVAVRTFHGWFAALLRGAPLAVLQDLGLPARYELLEDDAPLVERAWPRFHAALASDPAAEADYVATIRALGRHQTAEALRQAVARRAEFRLADAAAPLEGAVQPVGALYPALHGLSHPACALAGDSARNRWHAWARALGAETTKTPRDAADKLIDAWAGDDDEATCVRRLADLRKALFKSDELRLRQHLAKFDAAQAAEAELVLLCQAADHHAALDHHQRLTRLTRVMLAALDAVKREQGWVDMTDIEGAARRLLGDAELSGWLQQRLDARVRHLLVDEFQDTNPLQWQALYGWLSAYAGAGSGEAPCVFLVGDPKQSIYRFRRAEPQVFRAAQAFVVEALGGARLSCDHTRRCAPAVVAAVNEVMLAAAQAGELGGPAGAGFRPHTTASRADGAVLALPLVARPPKADAGADRAAWRDSLTEPRHTPEEAMPAREAAQVADWIAAECAAGRVTPGDVMVLARRRERLGWLHDALRERGLPSDAPETTALLDAPVAQDVLALLDALVWPDHLLSLARALRSPLLGWGDDDLAALARAARRTAHDGAEPAWWDVLLAGPPAPRSGADADPEPAWAERWRATAARLPAWRAALHALPPHDALARILREADAWAAYAAAVPPARRAAALAELDAVLAQSLAVEGGRFLGAHRWLRALRAAAPTLDAPAAPGAVRLLTIHGAKGLEAHTVVLLDTHSPPSRASGPAMLVDWPGEAPHPRRLVFLARESRPPRCAAEALAIDQAARAGEELNALYVALTRAERRLVVSAFEPFQSSRSTTVWQRLQPLAAPLEAPAPAAPSQGEASDGAPAVSAWALPELPSHRRPLRADTAAQPPAIAPAAMNDAGDDSSDDVATRLGLAVHRLLQWLPTPDAGFDWTDAHALAVSREFGLDAAARAQALALAARMRGGDAAWAWSADAVDQADNEVELHHAGQPLRCDRVVRTRADGTWWVLDFKTREHPGRDPALRAQLARYRDALRAAQPGAPVRAAFIDNQGRLVELPHAHPDFEADPPE